jgi:hypothetical protein
VCEGEQRLHCGDEDPISCIDQCEVTRSRNPGCEACLTALTDCVEALPLSDFECKDGSTSRRPGTCNVETQLLQICSARAGPGWRSVCDGWVIMCAPEATTGPDGGSDVENLYLSCLNHYEGADTFCHAQLISFVDCLDLHSMSCQINPADSDECPAEKTALENCDTPFIEMCQEWTSICRDFGAPPDAGAQSQERCLQSRPAETGSRCAQERSALYTCAMNDWRRLSIQERCDVPPLARPSCGAEHLAFDACAASNIGDGGAAR